MKSLLVASICALGCSGVTLRGEGAIHVSYLVAGGAAHPGGKAPATGGAAIMPAARLLAELPGPLDPYLTAAPAIVAPSTLKSMAFVGAFDAGASWHPTNRAWSLGTGGTIAPTWMRFCNSSWCLREWVWLYGGETHVSGSVVHTENGGGLTASLSARVLTGRPTAWYWPSLTAEERDIAHFIVSIGGAATWRF